MKRILKWSLAVVAVLVVTGFGAFLYFIPPFFLIAPEQFSKDIMAAPPPVGDIADPAERAIAERGLYIVRTTGCIGCHATNGPQGPDLTKYLAGGAVKFQTAHATYVSRNLTPDKETGLGKWTRAEIVTALVKGKRPDGRELAPIMPWRAFAHLSKSDANAIAAYLQSLPPVKNEVPGPFGPKEKVSVFVMDLVPAEVFNSLPPPPPPPAAK